jgi:hypothetical protein
MGTLASLPLTRRLNYCTTPAPGPDTTTFYSWQHLQLTQPSPCGRLANVMHPAGNVTGLTLIDFLALPAKAKLSISYSGEGSAEGFFSLRKL